MPKQDVLFVLTIDTEEEWQWDEEFPQHDCSVENVEKLPEFQSFCEHIGIRPTYFVDYAVASNEVGSQTLRRFAESNKAEIGAHLHPWCNPPYFGKTTEADSHVVNLPYNQVEQKLDALNTLLQEKVGVRPNSFRSGRWGINAETLRLLSSRGYQVDSSVYPFYKNNYFSCIGAPERPYWPSFENELVSGEQRQLLELPVTAGFNIKNFSLGENIHNKLSKAPFNWFKSVGLLWHLKLLRKIYLSPELTDTKDMISLINQSLQKQHPVIHMYLHSSSLIDGATGLLDVENAFTKICTRIQNVTSDLKDKANVKFCTISEAGILLANQPTVDGVIDYQKAM
jgi:hypothetical protein